MSPRGYVIIIRCNKRADLIVAFLANGAHEGRSDLEADAASGHALLRLGQQQLRDGASVAHAQLPEHHYLVQPVQELRPKIRL